MKFTKFGKLRAISALALTLTISAALPNRLTNAIADNISLSTILANNGVINSINTLDQTNIVKSHHWLNIIVPLKLRHQNKLNRLILKQADPGSSYFQKYLTVKQFNSEFAPSAKHYMMLVNYLTSQGINITAVSPNHIFIEITASASQLVKIFGKPNVKQNNSSINKNSMTETYYTVPNSLKNVVANISVLADHSISTSTYSHSYLPPSGWPSGFSPQQIDTVYNYPNSNNLNVTGKTYSGQGVTIAIASINGTYNLNDVKAFWNHFGIARTGSINNVPIGKPSDKLSFETTIDVEQAGASAPGANILVYEARNSYLENAALMLNRIVTDNKADIISCSWGAAENLMTPNIIETTHEIFKEAAVQGIAIFAASGDNGAYDNPNSQKPSVNYPASDPYVTAVGGTTLVIRGNGTRDLESAWSGSGGGVSKIFNKPTWQNIPGMPNNQHRDLADVSLDADTNTGYATLFKNQWIEGGGTSYATPNWAAGWALAIEEVGHRIAMPDVYIYDIANSPVYNSIFYDIKSGNNGNHVRAGYRAGVGFDYPTGWGTPNMSLLATWLANYKPMPTHTNNTTKKIGHNPTSVPVHTSTSPIRPKPKQLCVRTLAVKISANTHYIWAKAGPIWTKQAPVTAYPVNREPATKKSSPHQLESGGHRELRGGSIWTTSIRLWTYSDSVKREPNT